MTDYATHESDVVGDWVQNMSPLYKSYKACLKYGIDNGTLRKKIEAKQYQGVSFRIRRLLICRGLLLVNLESRMLGTIIAD